MRFIADRRCALLGLAPVFAETDNPFPWMSEAMDLKKEKKFLRDPGHRISERRLACLGLSPC